MLTLRISTRFGGAARSWGGPVAGRAPAACEVELVPVPRRAAAPRPVALASGLERPISDGIPAYRPGLAAVEADRGFSAGSFLLPGQIVDRSA